MRDLPEPQALAASGLGETVESVLKEWNIEMGPVTDGPEMHGFPGTDDVWCKPACILADMKAAAAGELKYASLAALAAAVESVAEKQWAVAAAEWGDNRLGWWWCGCGCDPGPRLTPCEWK